MNKSKLACSVATRCRIMPGGRLLPPQARPVGFDVIASDGCALSWFRHGVLRLQNDDGRP
ncbi:hypothetical protein [Parapedobacter sp.]